MNGMSNLPQIYQDFMRSQFASALNQPTNGNGNGGGGGGGGGGGSTLLTTTAPFADLTKLSQFAQQQQMAAAFAALQKQQQQQSNYVHQMQAQMNAIASAAAAAQQQQQLRAASQHGSFAYAPKSFFMPANLDQIKSTINSFYQHQNGNASANSQR